MNHIFRILLLSICLLAFSSNLSSQFDRRFVAEWERAWGTLIRWPLGIPSSLVVELAKDDSLYVLVANQSQLNQATNTFSSWGVNLNHTRFIFAATNSHWTRDWGPHFVFDEAGVCGIADPVFDGYPWVPGCFLNKSTPPEPIPGIKDNIGIKYANDNLVNGVLATKFECPLISLPIYLTGGNVMVDGRNTAIATRQMLDENFPGFTEAQFRQIAEDSLGITNFIIVENPEINGIQHIDCYAKYLNETTILVKQVDPWNPEYACCEALATHLANELNCYGEPYNILRIYCGSYSGNNTAGYTNSLILNNKVLVPLFSIGSDATAIQTYQDAMPGYEVIGFPWSAWYYYDALHCRTMGIFDFGMLYIRHDPLTGIQPLQSHYDIQAEITAHSNATLYSDSLLIIYSIDGGAWDTASMSRVSATYTPARFRFRFQAVRSPITCSPLTSRAEESSIQSSGSQIHTGSMQEVPPLLKWF
jgi:agmatine deiminase